MRQRKRLRRTHEAAVRQQVNVQRSRCPPLAVVHTPGVPLHLLGSLQQRIGRQRRVGLHYGIQKGGLLAGRIERVGSALVHGRCLRDVYVRMLVERLRRRVEVRTSIPEVRSQRKKGEGHTDAYVFGGAFRVHSHGATGEWLPLPRRVASARAGSWHILTTHRPTASPVTIRSPPIRFASEERKPRRAFRGCASTLPRWCH